MSKKIKPMTPGVSSGARTRAYLAGAVVTFGLFGVGMRAWALQVDDGDRYRALAERQHEMRLEIPAPRGEVLDTHGAPLAVSAEVDSIWANPKDVKDLATTAETLAKLTGADAAQLEAKLASDHKFTWLARHVDPSVAKKVAAAKLPGIELAKEPRRWYPAKSIAGPVIGRADIDNRGLDGIELSMNEELSGKRVAVDALRDARGHTMLAEGVAPTQPGATVKLTIDRSIQAIAEDALAEAVAVNKPKAVVAVVLEIGTSHVLAMASYPSYDPNTGDSHGARNLPVTDAFEAGSVMKIFSVASALEAGVVNPDTEFQIGNAFYVGGRAITDHEFDAYLTTTGIIKRSSNIGAAKIALLLGAEKLYDNLKLFGFGAKSQIELPGERQGMLRNGKNWREIDLAHIAYGYGLTVTPLQVAAALATIGDKGMYHEPRIVEEVRDGDGNVTYKGEGASHRAVSEKTAAKMMKMLEAVFDKGDIHGKGAGTAAALQVVGFKCAGKTGTAYKFDTVTKSYGNKDHYISSFAGIAPAENPRLAVVVMVDDPSGVNHYGGSVAGPVFAKIASEGLRYLGVPGMAPPPPKPDPAAAVVKPAPKPVKQVAAPVPDVVDPDPEPAVTVSDFAGLGVQKALDKARELHIPVEVIGSGRVIAQDPPAGPATSFSKLTLRFSDETRGLH
ncbi:MAG: penicillin-binding transpeptidase domain-containing protein [Kofleriaceae bacterium]